MDNRQNGPVCAVEYVLVDWSQAPAKVEPKPAAPVDDEVQALIAAALVAEDEAIEAREDGLRAAGLW